MESTGGDFASKAVRFVELTGESALHAAIQDPLDTLEQLANHAIIKPFTGHELPRLELVSDLPKAGFGSADWFAESIGVGIGRTADIVALGMGLDAIGATSSVGNFASSQFANPMVAAYADSAARMGLTAGIYGFGFVGGDQNRPDFWRHRIETGIGWGLGGAVGGIVGEYASSWLSSSSPEIVATGAIRGLANKTLPAVARASTGAITKTGTFAVLGTEQFTARGFSERMIHGLTKSVVTSALPS